MNTNVEYESNICVLTVSIINIMVDIDYPEHIVTSVGRCVNSTDSLSKAIIILVKVTSGLWLVLLVLFADSEEEVKG